MPAVPSNLIDNARVKLGRLKEQIDAVVGSEHPNSDSRLAVLDLGGQVDKLVRRLAMFEQYPLNIQNSLLKQANYLIYIITELLGFLVRSTSTRNLFEMYHPFLEISKKLVGEDVHLILSSDWQFSPFTYPFNLDQLPNYILIGLPASESENVLLFPTAAHELGHNIWKAKLFGNKIKLAVEEQIYIAVENNILEFERVFNIKGADIRNDMFVQAILRSSVNFSMRQLEELFCDFTGIVLFGEAYVYAFDYLLAPTLGGRRSGEYPGTRSRVSYMTTQAANLGIDISGMSDRFAEEDLPGIDELDFGIKMADIAVERVQADVFDKCKIYITERLGQYLTDEGSKKALASFTKGIPVSDVTSLGDLLNAAWRFYNANPDKGTLSAKGVELIPFVTDLVIKSAEALEYRSFVKRA